MKIAIPGRSDLPFYDLRFGVAADFPEHLRRSPRQNPTQPVFAAKFRMNAPYPDVQHVIPVHKGAIVAYQRGDRSVIVALAQELLAAHVQFLRELRSS